VKTAKICKTFTVKQRTLAVFVDFVDHVHELLLGRILTKTPHDHSELLAVNVSAVIFVKQLERLANFCNRRAKSELPKSFLVVLSFHRNS